MHLSCHSYLLSHIWKHTVSLLLLFHKGCINWRYILTYCSRSAPKKLMCILTQGFLCSLSNVMLTMLHWCQNLGTFQKRCIVNSVLGQLAEVATAGSPQPATATENHLILNPPNTSTSSQPYSANKLPDFHHGRHPWCVAGLKVMRGTKM